MRFTALATTFAVAAVLTPAAAHAGTYDVYACRLPDGSPAPTDGWTSFATSTYEPATNELGNACASGGALTARMPGGAPSGGEVGWAFDPPPGITIEGFVVRRAASSSWDPAFLSSIEYLSTLDAWPATSDGGEGESCNAANLPGNEQSCLALGAADARLDPSNRYERRGLYVPGLTLSLRCFGGDCPSTSFPAVAGMTIFDATETLLDAAPPRFEGNPTLIDGSSISLSVSDRGSGVADVDALIDGHVASRESAAALDKVVPRAVRANGPVPAPVRDGAPVAS
jgi:hypothetical protein